MKRRFLALLLVLSLTISNALAQYLLKVGMQHFALDISLLTNYPLFFGLFLYGVGAVLLIMMLRIGQATVYYPIVSLTYVWVTLLSYFYLGETISTYQVLGIGTILAGVFVVTKK